MNKYHEIYVMIWSDEMCILKNVVTCCVCVMYVGCCDEIYEDDVGEGI